MKQTKIVASVSDRRCDVDFIRQLFNAGVNVVRMNTAHASEEGLKNIIRNVREVSRHIGILIDTKGPEVRTTGCAAPMEYKTGDVVELFGRPEVDSTHDIVNLSYENFAADVQEGDMVLFDDGALGMKVIGINGPAVIAQVMNDGVLGAHKSVNVPGRHIDLPALTAKDRKNIMLAIDQDIDYRGTPGADSRYPVAHHQQMYREEETRHRGYPDAAYDDQQSAAYTRRGDGHRQRHPQLYRRPDALWRDGQRKISHRGRQDDGRHRRTGRARPSDEQHQHAVVAQLRHPRVHGPLCH